MKTLNLYPQPLYKGEASKWYRRSPRHTLLYAENGKVRVKAIIPSAGNPGKRGRGARTEVVNEFGPEHLDDLLEVMAEAEKQEKEAAESNEAAESDEEPFALRLKRYLRAARRASEVDA
jgi:hypothetical protein